MRDPAAPSVKRSPSRYVIFKGELIMNKRKSVAKTNKGAKGKAKILKVRTNVKAGGTKYQRCETWQRHV